MLCVWGGCDIRTAYMTVATIIVSCDRTLPWRCLFPHRLRTHSSFLLFPQVFCAVPEHTFRHSCDVTDSLVLGTRRHKIDRGQAWPVSTMPAKLSDFTVLDTIGSGSFGICKRVRRVADGKQLVWKELDYGQMSAREKEMLVSEVRPLHVAGHVITV